MKTPAMVLVLVALFGTGAAAAAPLETPVAGPHEEAKPMGPIAVDVRLGARPALGVPLTVTVTARAQAIDSLELEVRADDPAALLIGEASGPVDRAGVRTWLVTVVPMRSPGGSLNVVVAGEIDGVAQGQSVTTKVSLTGAAPAVRALSNAPAEAGGEKLSVLPVEERF